MNTVEVANKKPQPYRCKDCRKHFSCRTGTPMQSSKLPVRKWLYAMYLMSVSKKSLSSPQLARELGIAQDRWQDQSAAVIMCLALCSTLRI